MVWSFLSSGAVAQTPISQRAVRSLPDIIVFDASGKQYRLKDIGKNRILVVQLWNLACPPCFQQMHLVNQVYRKYKDHDKVTVLTISRTDPKTITSLLNNDTSGNDALLFYRRVSGNVNYILPTYFPLDCKIRYHSFKITDQNYQWKMTWSMTEDSVQCPHKIFEFSHYPATIAFDTKGKTIFHKIGFHKTREEKYFRKLDKRIQRLL
jgi:thiol-disulfide isomerase/thioredoxin